MKKDSSLFELDQMIKELKDEIKKAEDNLGAFRDYKLINGGIVLDYTLSQSKAVDEYLNKKTGGQLAETFQEYTTRNADQLYITLDEYKDKMTGKNYTKFEKSYISNKIMQVEGLKERKNQLIEQRNNLKYGKPKNKNPKKDKSESLSGFIERKAKQLGFEKGKTVKSKIKLKLFREAKQKNVTKAKTVEAISKTLSRLGYSKEKSPQ